MICDIEEFVVVGDVHAESTLLEAVAKKYPDTQKILLGDIVHGFDLRTTMDIIGEHDMLVVAGNHDLVDDAAMHDVNEERRGYWIEHFLANPKYRGDFIRQLGSYGIEHRQPTVEALDELCEVMPSEHKKILHTAPLYLETPQAVLVHAGLTSQTWSEQREELDHYAKRRTSLEYDDIPAQLNGSGAMKDEDYLMYTGIAKVIVNGHWHSRKIAERVTAGGRRVLLAAPRYSNHLFVWESWSGQVQPVSLSR